MPEVHTVTYSLLLTASSVLVFTFVTTAIPKLVPTMGTFQEYCELCLQMKPSDLLWLSVLPWGKGEMGIRLCN